MKDRKQEIVERIEQNKSSIAVFEEAIEKLKDANHGREVRSVLSLLPEKLSNHVFYRVYDQWTKIIRYDLTREEFINVLETEINARENSTRRYERELRKLNDET